MMSRLRNIIILVSLFAFLSAALNPAAERGASAGLSLKIDSGAHDVSVSAAVAHASPASHKNLSVFKHRPRSKRASVSLLSLEPSLKNALYPSSSLLSDGLYHQWAAVFQQPALQQLRTIVLLI